MLLWTAVVLGEVSLEQGDAIGALRWSEEALRVQRRYPSAGILGPRARRLDVALKSIGRLGETASRAEESVASLERLLLFLTQGMKQRKDVQRDVARVKSVHRDIRSLTEHLRFLTDRLTFLLDAVLGMIANEQNQIIKLFSVMAVMLMPPTLVASIYGMNFKHMPELEWPLGYPLALILMLVAALIPYIYFRRKGWL